MTVDVLYGDAWELAGTLESGSVDCIVTSPPYWGLRDYGTARWEGGDPECNHRTGRIRPAASTLTGGQSHLMESEGYHRNTCPKCGARRVDRQFGLESSPHEYVAKLVDLFARLRPALKDCGTVWLNLGDSYATGAGKVGDCPGGGEQGERWKGNRGSHTSDNSGKEAYRPMGPMTQPNRMPLPGLKPKDLVGIPWRVAFALQADGWYLRSDIIWAKPNPMPESVTDRPTKSHEYLFLLAKSERYYFDREAVKEPCSGTSHTVNNPGPGKKWRLVGNHSGLSLAMPTEDGTRNIRTVWTITTKPYSGAHFATFPPKLVEPCIKAGCPDGGTVLDPFLGSGTTAEVAAKLGRNCIGFELNEDYRPLIEKRLAQEVMV